MNSVLILAPSTAEELALLRGILALPDCSRDCTEAARSSILWWAFPRNGSSNWRNQKIFWTMNWTVYYMSPHNIRLKTGLHTHRQGNLFYKEKRGHMQTYRDCMYMYPHAQHSTWCKYTCSNASTACVSSQPRSQFYVLRWVFFLQIGATAALMPTLYMHILKLWHATMTTTMADWHIT